MVKKQKKNWVLRITSLALLFTLVSTCLLSNTMAKYVTATTGTDTARVAKWGWGGTATANIFQTSYNNSSGVLTVQTDPDPLADGKKLVAPGTSGTVTLTPSGTSEVRTRITYAVTETNTGGIPIIYEYSGLYYTSSSRYAPGTTYHLDLSNGTGTITPVLITGNLTALATALSGGGTPIEVAPNTPYTTAAAITWYWAYEEQDGSNAVLPTPDTDDTTLGTAGTAGIDLTVTLTATQVD